jgi:hypothetical protein
MAEQQVEMHEAKMEDEQKQRLALLAGDLFSLQDLDSNGLLSEKELVKLNIKIAVLHYGEHTNKQAVEAKYQAMFRDRLDSEGRPVPLSVFQSYVSQMLDNIDPDLVAQEMMLEQFIREAACARNLLSSRSFRSLADISNVICHEADITKSCKSTCRDEIPSEGTTGRRPRLQFAV